MWVFSSCVWCQHGELYVLSDSVVCSVLLQPYWMLSWAYVARLACRWRNSSLTSIPYDTTLSLTFWNLLCLTRCDSNIGWSWSFMIFPFCLIYYIYGKTQLQQSSHAQSNGHCPVIFHAAYSLYFVSYRRRTSSYAWCMTRELKRFV